MKRAERMKVVSQKLIAEDIYELVLSGPLVEEMGEPGQFVHVKVSDGIDPLLRRPISICDINEAERTFTVVYRKEGKGTALLSEKRQGEEVDVLGPLGNGFPATAAEGGTALLVGGGIGVPPLYFLSKKLKELGVKVVHVLGFKTANAVFYEQEFRDLGPVYIATEDGSIGTKGFVTDVILEKQLPFDTLYACGPTPMLKAVSSFEKTESNIFLSLEERMGCGIGACFACVCHTAGYSYKKVCSDGPVFRAGEVVLP